MTKPGSKILALYPNTDHYTVFVHNEVDKYSDWIGYKDFALTDNITFDLCSLGIDPEKIINNQVNLCLELKAANENMEARLTDDNWVPFNGYRYIVNLSENSTGMSAGISLTISDIPAEAAFRTIYITIDNWDYQIHWTDKESEVKAKTFTYPLVVPNTEYEVKVDFFRKDSNGNQTDKIASNTIKTTPKGGSGSIIAVNAPDIEGRIEGHEFVWVTKPVLQGTHVNGKFNIMFFNDHYSYLGGIGIPYSELKNSAHTGFDFADAWWNDQGKEDLKTLSVLNLTYRYEADDESGDYDNLPNTIDQHFQTFTNVSFFADSVKKTITIEDVEETVVIAKNYPWVDGVQDTTQAILNYEASLDVTDLYGSELPKKWDMVHLVWNGVSDRDIKKLSVKAVDRSEVANWWTEFSNGGLLKENIKADTPFSIEMDLLFTEDCIENINLVIFVEPEDVADEPTITTVSK